MGTDPHWLLLIHQLPAKPAYARVKVWRRLQALGAVTVKNAVYALPATARRARTSPGSPRRSSRAAARRSSARRAWSKACPTGAAGAVRRGARRGLRRDRRRGARARPARLTSDAPDGALAEIASAGRAAAQAARRDRRHRFLRRRTAARRRRRTASPGSRRRCKQEGDAMSDGKRRGTPPGRAARADLGDAPGRAGRSHRLGLADPPLHRSRRALQVRARQGLRARSRRAALRHVRGRVHPRGRPLHLRGAARPRRPGRPGARARSARSSTTSTSRTASTAARRRPASAP